MTLNDGTIVAEGLGFLEAPRWHDGQLWFSDFYSRRVSSVDESGKVTPHVYVPGQPSGLGFLDDGTVLIVSTHEAHLLRWNGTARAVVADIGAVYRGGLNDMVVDRFGRAYISTFPPPAIGQDHVDVASLPTVPILMVDPDGAIKTVADDLKIANGMVITPDGGTLIVAETLGNRLLAYDIRADGTLDNYRVFAEMGERQPDGICLDADGNVWVGCFSKSEFALIEDGGKVLRTIPTPGRWAVACALGGEDGKTLFGLTVRVTIEDYMDGRGEGTIMAYRVDAPAA